MVKFLLFADDLVILTRSAKDASLALSRLQQFGGRLGINISAEKTESMWLACKPSDCEVIYLDTHQIKEVDSLTYLGSVFVPARPMDCTQDILHGKQRLRAAMRRSKPLLSLIELSPKVKSELIQTVGVSGLLYGSETWKLTSSTVSKLEATLNRLRLAIVSNSQRLKRKGSSFNEVRTFKLDIETS